MKPPIRQVPRMAELQNEKGPATAPTVPSHGSTQSPRQDIDMNNTDTSTGQAAAPAPLLDCSDLEPAICDLAVIADVTQNITQRLLESPALEDHAGVHFTMSRDQWNQIFFLVADVRHRAFAVKEGYYAVMAAEAMS